ncbi:phage tail sheath family protein [Mycobacterium sp. PDNC021]|uniref:phage tail sheath family protein n=1 Tax=Mycobacterium sp. PDNC021 TaxID=3391399 RepID=UPI003AAADC74
MTAHPANPGVTVELIDRDATGIQPLRTDIAGFVGVATRGPVGNAVPIGSWRQFQSAFGGLHPDARLADAVKGFFDNGGRRAHVVRAAAPAASTAVDPTIPPDPTGASTVIVPAPGFVAGAVANVTLTKAPVAVTVSLAGVDSGSSTLTWATPLPGGIADLWTDRPVIVTAADGAATATADGATQPHDHSALIVRSVGGFRVGQQIELLQTERSRTVPRRIIDVLDGGRRLVWEQALPPDFAADPALTLATGSACASAVFANESGDPLFEVTASSPGIWGNTATVLVRCADGAGTATPDGVEQPADRTATRVLDVSGFSRGDLVRITQPGRPGRPAHAVVSAVDAQRRELIWQHPDPIRRTEWDGTLPGAIDHRLPMVVVRLDLTVGVEVSNALRASYGRLSLLAEHQRYAPPIVAAGPEPLITLTPLDAATTPSPRPDPAAALVPGLRAQPLVGGGDGLAAITAVDLTGPVAGPAYGIAALAAVNEIAILVAPDAHLRPGPVPAYLPPPPPPDPCDPCVRAEAAPQNLPPAPVERAPWFTDDDTYTVQQALVAQCEQRRDRVAILDAPARDGDPQTQLAIVRAWRKRFDTSYAALYHPWLVTLDGERTPAQRLVPPGGFLAGVYAQLDLSVGVHRAPANTALRWTHDVGMHLTDVLHGVLNDEAINAIRADAGRGIRPMGARTLSSDTLWRFVNVRRLLAMIEKALCQQLQWAVFEPANWITRELLRLGVAGLLETLWATGALNGATAAEAFYVKCDDTNNPPADVANGLLVLDIGVAPTAPAEFVVLRIGKTREEITVLDPVLAHGDGAGANR